MSTGSLLILVMMRGCEAWRGLERWRLGDRLVKQNGAVCNPAPALITILHNMITGMEEHILYFIKHKK